MTHFANATPTRAMYEVVAGLTTKSDKIRALNDEGYARADIARYLGIRYQHVRNVLVQPRPSRSARNGVAVSPNNESRTRVSIGPGGRIVIPTVFRQALGIEEGDKVVMRLDGDELRIYSVATSVRRAQDLVARYLPDCVNVVEDFIAERRREAAREERGE